MPWFAKFGDTNTMSNRSVLPVLLSRCVCVCSNITVQVNKIKLLWIFWSIGPEVLFLAQPKYSNFELKSPINIQWRGESETAGEAARLMASPSSPVILGRVSC